MKLPQILAILQELSVKIGSATPYICGGVPRDKIRGDVSKINDLDITTGDDSVNFLAWQFAKKTNAKYQVKNDGHIQVIIDGFKVDFSTHFIDPSLKEKEGTQIQLEMLSRDFTCNALLMSLDLETVVDPLGRGVKDIQDKILNPCLDPDRSLGNNLKRIPRIPYLACKLGFSVSSDMINWVKEHGEVIRELKTSYISEKINSAYGYDSQKCIDLLDRMNLWKYLPPIPALLQAGRGKF